MGQGPHCITFRALEGRRQNSDLNFQKSSVKNRKQNLVYSLICCCGFILMLCELLWIVISCKVVDSSIKFTFFHKISISQKMFLLHFNLLRGPDIIPTGAGSGLRVVDPCCKKYFEAVAV